METVQQTEKLGESLERLIDQTSWNVVIGCLAEIAAMKADHLRENWQDERTAKMYERAQRRLDRLSLTIFD